MNDKIKKTFYYINSFDVKSGWANVIGVILALILVGAIIYLGVIYTIETFGK